VIEPPDARETHSFRAEITAARLAPARTGIVLVGEVAVDCGAGRVRTIAFRFDRDRWLPRKHLHRAAGVEFDAPVEELVGRRVRVSLREWTGSDGIRRLGVRRWLRPLAADRTPARHGADAAGSMTTTTR
jgi:hypothetical protein